MTALGHEAEVAHDGVSALSQAEALHPDVILLDLMMPGMSGAEVARRLRSTGGPRPWLIAVTGLPESLLSRDDAAPFDCRLDKPVEPSHLLAVLRALEGVEKSGG